MTKQRYIIANWKMNMSLPEIVTWLNEFKNILPTIPTHKTVILSPSFPYLGLLSELTADTKIELAAQDISLFEKGAHTGSVGIFQIRDFCKYCIIGHSERKEPFEDSLKKRDICIANNVVPIFCVATQDHIRPGYSDKALTVWEDPAAISVGGKYQDKPFSTIKDDIISIRQVLPSNAFLIYGGSVNKQNIDNLSSISELDGVLVGNASLDPNHFAELVKRF